MAKRKMTDAQEPNAGYDFHVTWTIRKCLELLNFSDEGLKSIAVENLDPVDSTEIDQDGDILLGVDLTEYYGGENFASAKKVIVSQLKYSTRHSEMQWTASKVTTGKKGSNGSIVHRLATIYGGMATKHSVDQLRNKLQLKLVSNRPASALLISITDKAKSALVKTSKRISLDRFKKVLTVKETREVDKLLTASKLKAYEFLTFLSLLDFSDCNTGSRFIQKLKSYEALNELGAWSVRTEHNNLHELVREKTMVAAKGNNIIIKEDILILFGFSDIRSMFPVPAKLETLQVVVEREQMLEIKDAIIKNVNAVTCLHGGAGIGKSTIAKSIESILPENSAYILFDCYGRGSYQDADDKRHKHENAFLFLCNEMALKTGSPLLVRRGESNDFYLSEFKKRVELASEILTKTDPSCLLSIIIDAADNSVMAAKQKNDPCFLHDLLTIKFPINVRLIVTTRTNRLDLLLVPNWTKLILINPFSVDETRIYLNSFSKHLGENKIIEFHRLTKGVPRVMFYTLKSKGKTLADKIKPLNPGGKNLDEVFKYLLTEAEVKSGDKRSFKNLLTYLILLPRPVPMKYLVECSGIEKAFIEDIAIDLWNGLIYENELFSFRDEDFENFLHTHYQASTAEFKKIAEFFIADRGKNDYTSIHLGNFLSLAGKQRELKEIVLSRSHLDRPIDQVRNKEVFIERARLAMQHASLEDSRLTFLKLQAVAAEASKTNTILENIMTKNPELISLFNNSKTSKKLYVQNDNPEWFGRVHLRSAAILSRNVQTHDSAKDHLKNARSWLRYRSSLDSEKRAQYDISEEDLAFGGEAYLRLIDVHRCVEWFSGWTPKDFVYTSIRMLLEILLSSIEARKIYFWMRKTNLRVDVMLLINRVFFQQGLALPFTIERINKKIATLKRIKGKLTAPLLECIISFAEQMAHYRTSRKKILVVLDLIKSEPLNRVPGFYTGVYGSDENLATMDQFFRSVLLKAHLNKVNLSVEDLLPPRLNVSTEKMEHREKEPIEEDKRKFTTFYNHLLPVYQLRTSVIVRAARWTTIKKNLNSILDRFEKDYEIGYRYQHDAGYVTRFIAFKLTDIVFYTPKHDEFINILMKKIQAPKRDNISVMLQISDKLSVTKRYGKNVLQLLNEIDKEIERLTLAGRTQIEHYTEATIIASRISESAGKDYFDKMVSSSREIDLEAHDQIRAIDHLAKSIGHLKNPKMAFEFARFAEYCSERLKGWDDFPWDEIFDAIANMDTASAFTVACRWDHRNVRKIGNHIIEILLIALNNGSLNHKIVAGLLPLNPYYWKGLKEIYAELIKSYNVAANSNQKIAFVSEQIRELKISCHSQESIQILSDFLQLIKDGKYLDKQIVDEFETYYERVTGICEEPEEKVSKAKNKFKDVVPKKIKLPKSVDVTSVKDIENILYRSRGSKKDYLDFSADTILEALFKKVKPNEYTGHLTALIEISPELLGYYTFMSALKKRLEEWKIFPEVKQWKKDNFEKVIRARFSNYITYLDNFTFSSLKQLADLFEIDRNTLCQAIIKIIPDYINDLSASSLWQLYHIISADTLITDKENFIKWLLIRWNENIKPEFGDGPYNRSYNPSTNISLVIAGFLRYNLGHPDKRIRWKAARSVVNIVNYGDFRILELLSKEQNKNNCIPFQNSPYTFYWIAAKLWLWIAVEKLAIENPAAIKKFAAVMVKELNNKDLPHAQIQLFIKSACNNLKAKYRNIYNRTKLSVINKSLTSTLRPVKKTKNESRLFERGKHKFQFPFDTIDTIDHWYAPLGRRFNLSGYDVADLAEQFIRQKWGYNGNVRDDNHVESNEYELIRHYKSDIPVIEDLRTYYEYHSMQCVAGLLIKTKPLLDHPDYYDSWNDWLKYYFLKWDRLWLSDLRDPIPLQSKFWINNHNVPNWEYNIGLKEFDEAAGFLHAEKTGYSIIESDVTIYYGKDYETQNVRAGLVDPFLAKSLLASLQTSRRYDFYIPDEKDIDEEEYQEEEDANQAKNSTPPGITSRFKIHALIKDISRSKEGVDESEPDISGLNKGRSIPATIFSEWCNLIFSPDYRFGYSNNNFKIPVSVLQNWSNTKPKESYGSLSSRGQRLFIKTSILKQFLSEVDKVMVVHCEVNRRPETREYKNDYTYYTLIYLIYPDGKVETLGRSFKLR